MYPDYLLFQRIAEKLKPAFSAEELAKKYDISIEEIEHRLDEGQKVELEHTKDKKTARHIASHHIHEFLNYYRELEKMEKRLKRKAADETPYPEFPIKGETRRVKHMVLVFSFAAREAVDFCLRTLINMKYRITERDIDRQRDEVRVDIEPKVNSFIEWTPELYAKAVDKEVAEVWNAVKKFNRGRSGVAIRVFEYDKPIHKEQAKADDTKGNSEEVFGDDQLPKEPTGAGSEDGTGTGQ